MGKAIISGVGGSSAGSDECTATKNELLKGYGAITKDSDDEVIQGTLELTGNAADSHVLAEKTYYNKDAKVKRTGTMPNRGAVNRTLNAGVSYTIPAGYHNGGGKVTANSLASQTSAGYILSGKTAWVNGQKVTGNIASMGGQTITPGASSHTLSCSGKYMTGNVYVPAVSNLSAGNIKKGVNVGGVTGTFEGYVPTATDLYLRGNNIKNWRGLEKTTFDSGQITIRPISDAWDEGGISADNISLVGFTKINFEIHITGKLWTSSGNWRMIFSTPDHDKTTVTIPETVLGNKVYSFDVSAHQQTGYVRLHTYDGKIEIYRIWLS